MFHTPEVFVVKSEFISRSLHTRRPHQTDNQNCSYSNSSSFVSKRAWQYIRSKPSCYLGPKKLFARQNTASCSVSWKPWRRKWCSLKEKRCLGNCNYKEKQPKGASLASTNTQKLLWNWQRSWDTCKLTTSWLRIIWTNRNSGSNLCSKNYGPTVSLRHTIRSTQV